MIPIKTCPLTDVEMVWIRRLADLGYSQRRIAEAICRSDQTIAKLIVRSRIKTSARFDGMKSDEVAPEILKRCHAETRVARAARMALDKPKAAPPRSPDRILWRMAPTEHGAGSYPITLPLVWGVGPRELSARRIASGARLFDERTGARV